MQHDNSAIETIQAMHSQELSGYVSGDYLNMHSPELVAVNVDCRTKMAQWCYSVRIVQSGSYMYIFHMDMALSSRYFFPHRWLFHDMYLLSTNYYRKGG